MRVLALLFSFLALAAFSSAAVAGPGPEQPLQEQVELLLSGIESIPSKATLQGLHPQVAAELRRIVEQPGVGRELARTRALTVLRAFPGKATAATLRGFIQRRSKATRGQAKTSLALLNLQQAVKTYAVVAGPSALALLQPFLSHDNADLRVAAAEAVRLSGGRGARALLQSRVRMERSERVRHQLQVQLKRMARTSRGSI